MAALAISMKTPPQHFRTTGCASAEIVGRTLASYSRHIEPGAPSGSVRLVKLEEHRR